MGVPIAYGLLKKFSKETWDPSKYSNVGRPPILLAAEHEPLENEGNEETVPDVEYKPRNDVVATAKSQFYGIDTSRYAATFKVNEKMPVAPTVKENANDYKSDMVPDVKGQEVWLREIIFSVDNPSHLVMENVPAKKVNMLNKQAKHAQYFQTTTKVSVPGTHNKKMLTLMGQRAMIKRVENVSVGGKPGQTVHTLSTGPGWGNAMGSLYSVPVSAQDQAWLDDDIVRRNSMGDAEILQFGVGQTTLRLQKGVIFEREFRFDEGSTLVLVPIQKESNEAGARVLNMQNGGMETKRDSVVAILTGETGSKEQVINDALSSSRNKNMELFRNKLQRNNQRTDFQVDVRKTQFERPTLTPAEVARMNRGFKNFYDPNGHTYFRPDRFVNDRYNKQTKEGWHIEKVEHSDRIVPSRASSTRTPAADPSFPLQNTKHAAQERDQDRFKHSDYEYNRASGARLDLKNKNHPAQNFRVPRQFKNTDINRQEIHADESVMRSDAHTIGYNENKYKNEKMERFDETRTTRDPSKHVNLASSKNQKTDRKDRRKPLGGYYGGDEEPSSGSKYYHTAGLARTTRPKNYTHHRGGQGSDVAKSKATVRLNQLNTVPGMMVGRAGSTRYLKGDQVGKGEVTTRRITPKVNKNALSKQYARQNPRANVYARGKEPQNLKDVMSTYDHGLRDRGKNSTQVLYRGPKQEQGTAANSINRVKAKTAHIPGGSTARPQKIRLEEFRPGGDRQLKVQRDNVLGDVHERPVLSVSKNINQPGQIHATSTRQKTDGSQHYNATKTNRTVPGLGGESLRNVNPENNDNDDSVFSVMGKDSRGELLPSRASQTLRISKADGIHKNKTNTIVLRQNDSTVVQRLIDAGGERNVESVRSMSLNLDMDGLVPGVENPTRLHVPRNAGKKASVLSTILENVQESTTKPDGAFGGVVDYATRPHLGEGATAMGANVTNVPFHGEHDAGEDDDDDDDDGLRRRFSNAVDESDILKNSDNVQRT